MTTRSDARAFVRKCGTLSRYDTGRCECYHSEDDESMLTAELLDLAGGSVAVRECVSRFPELNMGNYTDEDVATLNNWGLEICGMIDCAILSAGGVGGDEPITEEWLRSVGFTPYDTQYEGAEDEEGMWLGLNSGLGICWEKHRGTYISDENGWETCVELPHVKTRKQLANLCAALGIELNREGL